ncbi:MAG TPA: hypothetical protein VI172_08145 [Candidatus Dormibacteraeota bacterium]|jgi:hypothetical protein
MIAADFAPIRTTNDNGTDISRYTNFRAAIDLATARRYITTTGGQPDLRIEADDAHADMQGHGDDPTTYIWQSEMTGNDVDQPHHLLTSAADNMLAAEGFRPAGAWVVTSDLIHVAIEVSDTAQAVSVAKAEAVTDELSMSAHHLANMLTTWSTNFGIELPQHVKMALDGTRACLKRQDAQRSGWDYLPERETARQP